MLALIVAASVLTILYLTVCFMQSFLTTAVSAVRFSLLSLTCCPSAQNSAHRSQEEHDFYTSTVHAMDKADGADGAITQKLMDVERAARKTKAIPSRPASPLIPDSSPTTSGSPETGEKSVAGRKKMKGGEKYDMATGKEAAMVVDKEGAGKIKDGPERAETQEEHDIEQELNSILKKGPSMYPISLLPPALIARTPLTYFPASLSNHILQNQLPLLEKSQNNPAGKILHRPRPIRGRARQAPAGPWFAIRTWEIHGEEDCAQCAY